MSGFGWKERKIREEELPDRQSADLQNQMQWPNQQLALRLRFSIMRRSGWPLAPGGLRGSVKGTDEIVALGLREPDGILRQLEREFT